MDVCVDTRLCVVCQIESCDAAMGMSHKYCSLQEGSRGLMNKTKRYCGGESAAQTN